MPALVQAGIAARRVGAHHVLLEAVAQVFGFALEHDPHAEADVVGDRAPVALERRDRLRPGPFGAASPPSAIGRHDERDVVDRGRRIGKAVGRQRQAGRVAHRGALDRGLRAVEKRIEHLRVQAAARAPAPASGRSSPTRSPASTGQNAAATCGRGRLRRRRNPRRAPSRPDRRSAPAGRRRPGCRSRRLRPPGARATAPQKASASTVTLTTCLPLVERGQACSTAAIGLPVHSTTMSISGGAASACQSSARHASSPCGNRGIDRAAPRSAPASSPARARLALRAAGGEDRRCAATMHARRCWDLGKIHRAELAGADQADAQAACPARRAAQSLACRLTVRAASGRQLGS